MAHALFKYLHVASLDAATEDAGHNGDHRQHVERCEDSHPGQPAPLVQVDGNQDLLNEDEQLEDSTLHHGYKVLAV